MELTKEDSRLAEKLFNAYLQNEPIGKDAIPADLEKSTAYRIQHEVTSKKTSGSAEEVKGYKISLTSPETRDLFQSETPLYGALTSSSLSEGVIELESLISPLLEIELIFILKEDLSVEDDVHAILQKSLVAPGIEVPDSRFEDWFPKITLGQVIADSAVAGKIIAGTPKDGLTFGDLQEIQGTLALNGKELATGSSSTVLDHPANAVKWLAEELAGHGGSLKKGMYISSGTFTLPQRLEKGLYTASYEGLGEVSLKVR
ncbi:2-keto-4-pentenoate hydratase [Planococcus chinensis]|uniref:2-keto-4-pentenoate hydratase n=1 Tax=Planococcus chinensis TaxID=272917 RepID=A0ABW4QM42_9BACL